MKFTAEFSTSDFYGNQICKADTIDNLIMAIADRGFNFTDGMQNKIIKWSKSANKKYYGTGITIRRNELEMTEYASLQTRNKSFF